jgi:hypothetical protein
MEVSAPLTTVEEPIELERSYNWVVSYNYPGPLPCSSGMSKGCSDVVNAGPRLGMGRFCDYAVVCAGVTVTIFYNRFATVA